MDACPIGFEATPSWQRPNMVPIGGIITWSGAIVDIPAGYQLCDGTNGTPNLKDSFVIGAGNTYAVDAEGGSINHNHASGTTEQVTSGVGPYVWTDVDSALADNLPPFLALAQIQRMS